MKASLEPVVRALAAQLGWAESEALWDRLPTAVARAVASLGLDQNVADALVWLGHPAFLSTVAADAAVHETYFFRHVEQLDAACRLVLGRFPTGPLVAWSAGCATGEEAYSLALTLARLGGALERIDVLGTDQSEAALTTARQAEYRDWSLRGTTPAQRAYGFDAAQRVLEPYRRRVRFEAHNLLGPAPVAGAQLVLCRSVLIYLRPDAAERVLANLASAVASGGVLVLGASEQHLAGKLDLRPVPYDGFVLLERPRFGATPSAPRLDPRPSEPPAPPVPVAADPLEAAWAALHDGALGEARALAEREAQAQRAEAHLVLAALREREDDLPGALEQLRRALFLAPELAVAHATQASLFARLGRAKDAARAKSNALRHLEALDADTPVRAGSWVTVRALRAALEAS